MALSMSPRFSYPNDLPTGATDEELVAWGQSLLSHGPTPTAELELDLTERAIERSSSEGTSMTLDDLFAEISERMAYSAPRPAAERAAPPRRVSARLRAVDGAERPTRSLRVRSA